MKKTYYRTGVVPYDRGSERYWVGDAKLPEIEKVERTSDRKLKVTFRDTKGHALTQSVTQRIGEPCDIEIAILFCILKLITSPNPAYNVWRGFSITRAKIYIHNSIKVNKVTKEEEPELVRTILAQMLIDLMPCRFLVDRINNALNYRAELQKRFGYLNTTHKGKENGNS